MELKAEKFLVIGARQGSILTSQEIESLHFLTHLTRVFQTERGARSEKSDLSDR